MKKYLIALSVIAFAFGAFVVVFHTIALGASPSHISTASDLFYNYTSWTHTQNTQPVSVLNLNADFYNNGTTTRTPSKFTFTDINGDNLPDFLYHEKGVNLSDVEYYALFLNNGNNNFNLSYKCVRKLFRVNPSTYDSYGDCSTSATERDPNASENQNMLANVLYLASYFTGNEPPVYNHIWIDINGDGLQDYIDKCLNINNQAGMNRIYFNQFCS